MRGLDSTFWWADLNFEHAPGARARGHHTKKKAFRPSEQDRVDVQEKRRAFVEELEKIDPDDLVFIDESGCNIAMTAAYARGPRGERVPDKKPANWGKNLTVVGAITNDRVVCHRTIVGAMDKPRFVDFVENTLCPRLAPGSVVVLDNLRPHHAPEVRAAIEARGCRLLYQPPYSPDLNPIELCWSFIKARLRRLGKRLEEELRRAIRNTFLRVRTSHLAAWFKHCGYGQSK